MGRINEKMPIHPLLIKDYFFKNQQAARCMGGLLKETSVLSKTNSLLCCLTVKAR